MKLQYNSNRKVFTITARYEDREKAKAKGFMWNSVLKVWETMSAIKAEKALSVCIADEDTKRKIAEIKIQQSEEKEQKDNQKKIIAEKVKNGEVFSYDEIKPFSLPRVCHIINNKVIVYTEYNDDINEKLWQKFMAKWNKDLQGKEISLDSINKIEDFCKKNDFIFTREFYDAYERLQKEKEEKIADSKATDAYIDIPAPRGLTYLPFQKAGIAFANSRNGRVLIADEMGLGKTIQALGFLNLRQEDAFPALVVCPATMKLVWQNEAEKWLTPSRQIQIIRGKNNTDINGQVVICNYDLLESHQESLKKKNFQTIIFDESHYIKNHKAQRTQSALAVAGTAKYALCLSGTPFLNRPIEGWTTIELLAKDKFPDFWSYAKRYCNAHQVPIGRGRCVWDMNGASNLGELGEKLRMSIMVRRLKKDVLQELPAKQRTLIPIERERSGSNSKEDKFIEKLKNIVAMKKEVKKEMTEEEKQAHMERLREEKSSILSEIELLKQEAVKEKLKFAVEFIRDTIEQKKLVVFAHHNFVIEKLMKEFPSAACIWGESSEKGRASAIERFQNDENCKLFVGSMHTASVGITLTAASDVVFLEFDWTPSIHMQAEDRCHRIGQKDSVNAYYLALNNSIDISIARILMKKQNIVDQILDEKEQEKIRNVDMFDELIADLTKEMTAQVKVKDESERGWDRDR
jgi:SWI/SNF-related matrix-associated actin-dependent regulator 1 of chromatin subfamily A